MCEATAMMVAMTSTRTADLETDRLRLDPLRRSDATEMVRVLGSPELYRYTGGAPPTLAELERRYAIQTVGSTSPDEVWHNWIVRRRPGGAIGFVQATVTGEVGAVAWLIGIEAQGAGYAREAATAMIEWLASAGVRELRAHIHPDHVASRRVAETLGFVHSGLQDDDGEDVWILNAPQPSGNVVTAAELEKMSPAEQQALFDTSVVTDLDQVPAEFLERVRLRLEQHIDQTESAPKQK